MPLDNDTCDVKMPSLEGKAWAGANEDWVVYIGYNCEWELVNVYTRHWVSLPIRGSSVCCHHSWHCFAWNPNAFGTFVFHRNYNCFIHMHAG